MDGSSLTQTLLPPDPAPGRQRGCSSTAGPINEPRVATSQLGVAELHMHWAGDGGPPPLAGPPAPSPCPRPPLQAAALRQGEPGRHGSALLGSARHGRAICPPGCPCSSLATGIGRQGKDVMVTSRDHLARIILVVCSDNLALPAGSRQAQN